MTTTYLLRSMEDDSYCLSHSMLLVELSSDEAIIFNSFNDAEAFRKTINPLLMDELYADLSND